MQERIGVGWQVHLIARKDLGHQSRQRGCRRNRGDGPAHRTHEPRPTYAHQPQRSGGAKVGRGVDSLFLACCVRGMEVTRHYTPELGAIVASMLGFAVIVAVVLVALRPVLITRQTP